MSKITGSHKLLHGEIIALKGDLQFNIPYYQRPYSWGIEQLEDFWDSINKELGVNEEIFFGSLITSPTMIDEKEVSNSFDIVDGQQRIITFTILSLAILNNAKEDHPRSDYNKSIGKLEEFVKTDKDKIRLNTLKSDSENFENIQNLSISDILNTSLKEINNNFLNAYRFFAEKTHNLEKDKVVNLIKTIKDKIKVIHIEADDEQIAIDTFQTINSMGMSLDEENIAKSMLLSSDNQKLTKEWEKNFRSRKDGFKNSEFFNYYLAVEYANHPDLKGSFKKSKILKQFYKDLRENPNKEAKAKEIIKYAEIYTDILNDAYRNKDNNSSNYFYCLKSFKELGVWVFVPVLMYSLFNKEIIEVEKVSNHLENIIMSYALEGSSTKSFNNMLPILLKNPFSIEVKYSLEDIKHYLTSGKLKNNKARAILYLLEIRNYGTKTNLFNEGLSLEHIYPQNLRDGEKALYDEKLKYSIGNMMLLNNSLNKENSNKTFFDKLKKYEGDNIGHLQSVQYILGNEEKGFKKQTEWLDNQIEENAEYILGLIKDTWINKA